MCQKSTLVEGGGGSGQRNTLVEGGGGSGVRDMASPSLGKLGAKFSETSFPHFTALFRQTGHCLIFRQEFKTFDSNNYTLSVYLSVCLSIYLDICKITRLCGAIFPFAFNASPLH